MMPILATDGLTLTCAGRVLVDALSLRVMPGECWCIIGRNGAGKTTLLHTLAGLRKPDAGSIALHGKPLAQWPVMALARERALLPQAQPDAFGYRAIDTVLMARHPYQGGRAVQDGKDDLQIAHAALAAVDAAHLAGRDVRTLSGGERQRVALAALFAQQTPLLLLDEPMAALDIAHQESAMRALVARCAEGAAALFVSHDPNRAYRHATHALLIGEGGAWTAGPAGDVMHAGALGDCLGYPMESIAHAGRRIFVPTTGNA